MFARKHLVVLLGFFLVGPFAKPAAPPASIDELLPCVDDWVRKPLNKEMEATAFRSALNFHRTVVPDEVRVSSFPWDYAGAKKVWIVGLSSREVYACTDMSPWSIRDSRTTSLSQSEVLALRGLIAQLPPSVKVGKLKDLFLMSVVIDGRPKIFVYDLSELPPTVSRLYDIIGRAYLLKE
jgi:hypothetical protein